MWAYPVQQLSPYPMILQACAGFCFARSFFTDEFNNFMKLGLIFLIIYFYFLQDIDTLHA